MTCRSKRNDSSFLQLLSLELLGFIVAKELTNCIWCTCSLWAYVKSTIIWNVEQQQRGALLDVGQVAHLVDHTTIWPFEEAIRHGIDVLPCLSIILLSNSFHCCSHSLIITKCYQTGLAVQFAGIVVDIVERLWKPPKRQVFTLWILYDFGTTLGGDQRSIIVEHHKGRDTRDFESIREKSFLCTLLVGQSFPWHLLKIFIKGCLISVRGNEKYFHLVLQSILVKFGQLGSKAAAWWTPMGREVNANGFAPNLGNCFCPQNVKHHLC